MQNGIHIHSTTTGNRLTLAEIEALTSGTSLSLRLFLPDNTTVDPEAARQIQAAIDGISTNTIWTVYAIQSGSVFPLTGLVTSVEVNETNPAVNFTLVNVPTDITDLTSRPASWVLQVGTVSTGGSNVGSLNDLTDVTITNASDNQFLRRSGNNWINETVNIEQFVSDVTGDNAARNISRTSTNEVTTFTINSGLDWRVGQLIGWAGTNSDGTFSFSGVVQAYAGDTTGSITIERIGLTASPAGVTLGSSINNIVPTSVFPRGAQGQQGIQGPQGIGIASVTAPANPTAGSATEFTISYNNPVPGGTVPADDKVSVPAGPIGATGPQGLRGDQIFRIYLDLADTAAAPAAPTDVFTTDGINITGANAAGWTTAPPTTINAAGRTTYTTSATFRFSGASTGSLETEFGTPFNAANSGPEGPAGPPGRSPLLTQEFYPFDADGSGSETDLNNVFALTNGLPANNTFVLHLGTFEAINAHNDVPAKPGFQNLTVNQAVTDNDIAAGSIVTITVRNENNVTTQLYTAELNSFVSSTPTTQNPSTGRYNLTVLDVSIGADTTTTGDLATWEVSVGGVRGPQGQAGSNGVDGFGTQAQFTAIRNRALLTGGFLLARVSASDSGTREAYQGPIVGEDGQPIYWFDSSDSTWYDAATGGTDLIGF